MTKPTPPHQGIRERLSNAASEWAGTSIAFCLALLVVIVWAALGPVFGFADTWQLVINTGTTIVTFLMVFLIQRAQNKDLRAVHLKLNEIVAALKGASNHLINVEALSEEEIRTLHEHYCRLVELTRETERLAEAHSPQEAIERHNRKRKEK